MKAKKPSVIFNDSAYRFAHGHTPRGRGSWAFFFDRAQETAPVWAPPQMTFPEAKRWMMEWVHAKYAAEPTPPHFVDVYVGT